MPFYSLPINDTASIHFYLHSNFILIYAKTNSPIENYFNGKMCSWTKYLFETSIHRTALKEDDDRWIFSRPEVIASANIFVVWTKNINVSASIYLFCFRGVSNSTMIARWAELLKYWYWHHWRHRSKSRQTTAMNLNWETKVFIPPERNS